LYRALGWQSGMQFRASTRLHNRAKPARLPQWPADHLAVYDKLQPARCQPGEGPGHGVDRALVDVVGQDDAALMGVLQDAGGASLVDPQTTELSARPVRRAALCADYG
jgi:hypothetical protein